MPAGVKSPAGPSGAVASAVAQVAVKTPFAWEEALNFLRARAIPGVEEVTSERYRRSVRLGRAAAVVEVSRQARAELLVEVHGVARATAMDAAMALVVERAAHLFDVNANPRRINGVLGREPVFAASVRDAPGLRVPGAWDGFEIGVRAILGQQVTVKGASTLIGRLVALRGGKLPKRLRGGTLSAVFPTPCELLRGADSASTLGASIGIPAGRAACIAAFAHSVMRGDIAFAPTMDANAFYRAMVAIKGIGPWTAHYVAMRAHHDGDAFPSGDLALQRVMAPAGDTLGARELEAMAQAWRPWRAYAAMHMWRTYAHQHARSSGG